MRIDTPEYEGNFHFDLGEDEFLGFGVSYEDGKYSDRTPRTRASIYSHCCGTDLTDEQAVQVHAALGRYLADRRVAALGADPTRVHELKTWPGPFEGVKLGIKSLELRLNDRDYMPGDVLHLREWGPETGRYTGDSVHRLVTYVMFGGQWGLAEGWVAMSIVDADR